jgi:hypothetical protein
VNPKPTTSEIVTEMEKEILTLTFKDFFDKSFVNGMANKESY